MKNGVVCPAVTRIPGPCRALPGLAPAVAEVPPQAGGGKETGVWPDHSYCSWRGGPGRQDWESELGSGITRAEGRTRGGVQEGEEDRAHLNQTSSSSQIEEHRSALSLYDNLPDAVTPDNLQEVLDMETSFQESLQEEVPEQIPELMEGEASTWSSCEIVLADSGYCNQDQKPEEELDLTLHLQFSTSSPLQHLPANSPQIPPTESQAAWTAAKGQDTEQPRGAARAPPPVPPADPSASALRSILTSLQQQIVRQREEYEERIIG